MDVQFEYYYNDNYSEIAELLNAVFSQKSYTSWLNFLTAIWDKNIAYKNECKGIIATNESNKIIGFIGNFPTYMYINGEKLKVYNGTSLCVHPNYRKKQIGYNLRRIQVEFLKNNYLFATTPNNVTKHINYKLGFLNLSSYYSNDCLKKIIAFKNFNSIYHKLKITRNNLYSIILSSSIYTYNIIQNIINKTKIKNDIFIYLQHDVDKNIDILWNRTFKWYNFTNYRNSNYLNWYLNNFNKNNKFLFTIFYKNNIIAYAIFHKNYNHNLQYLTCIDFFYDRSHEYIKFLPFSILSLQYYLLSLNYNFIEIPLFDNNMYFAAKQIKSLKINDDILSTSINPPTNFNNNFDFYLTYLQGDKYLS